eukprot:CAMPEP_0116126574 /NCGR_PEP_ID=MMETSP0329-20121206/6400_1 /TAXON_ID=697910 /ORGANISM="Pseudo-nitzschia arenysensis, Strain B593" /LENGTH=169 /DNA_ID=CAMNT_0003620657 /DNA_START=53 /DNA_END=559 /DNA_ORIENTATION=-
MSGKPTHYDVLGVSKYATYEEIKKSFHRLARAKHPDKLRQKNPSQTEGLDSQNKDADYKVGDDEIATEFRKIQQAWEILRDEEQRSAYDSDLHHKDLQEENRRNGAIVLSFHDDLEEAIDEDTNECFMVYDCRCGEEIQIEMPSPENYSNSANESAYCNSVESDPGEIW